MIDTDKTVSTPVIEIGSIGPSLPKGYTQSGENSAILSSIEAEHSAATTRTTSTDDQVDITAVKEHSSEMLVDANALDTASTQNISSNVARPSHRIGCKLIYSNRFSFEIFCSLVLSVFVQLFTD